MVVGIVPTPVGKNQSDVRVGKGMRLMHGAVESDGVNQSFGEGGGVGDKCGVYANGNLISLKKYTAFDTRWTLLSKASIALSKRFCSGGFLLNIPGCPI